MAHRLNVTAVINLLYELFCWQGQILAIYNFLLVESRIQFVIKFPHNKFKLVSF